MSKTKSSIPVETGELLKKWSILWKVEGLRDRVKIEISTRLRTTLGRCLINENIIRLHSILVNKAFYDLFEEVLCHEVAHTAVSAMYGPECRAHGQEWRQLVNKAGFKPRTSIADRRLDEVLRRPAHRNKVVYEHRCRLCNSVWTAYRPMSRWRCAICLDEEQDNKLIITSRPIRTKGKS